EPGALAPGRESPVDFSARLLWESLVGCRAGDAARAHQLAVTSYLAGFELVEAPLSAVDGGLKTRVEAEMLRYRTLIQSRAPREAVEGPARAILLALRLAPRAPGRRAPLTGHHLHERADHPAARGTRSHPCAGRGHRHADQVRPPP